MSNAHGSMRCAATALPGVQAVEPRTSAGPVSAGPAFFSLPFCWSGDPLRFALARPLPERQVLHLALSGLSAAG